MMVFSRKRSSFNEHAPLKPLFGSYLLRSDWPNKSHGQPRWKQWTGRIHRREIGSILRYITTVLWHFIVYYNKYVNTSMPYSIRWIFYVYTVACACSSSHSEWRITWVQFKAGLGNRVKSHVKKRYKVPEILLLD